MGGGGCCPLQTQYKKWGPFNCLAQGDSIDIIRIISMVTGPILSGPTLVGPM